MVSWDGAWLVVFSPDPGIARELIHQEKQSFYNVIEALHKYD